MFFFLYSAIGIHLFGGYYTNKQADLIDPPNYIYNNFNDLYSSLVLLFELLIVNNWMVNAAVAVTIMGSELYR